MVVIGGTTNNFKIFLFTDACLAIHVVKDCRIVLVVSIIGKFLMRSHRNPQVFKDTNQVMTSRFSDVDGIAAIARITIKEMRTYIKWNPVLESQEIFQTIIAFENHLNSASRKILRSKSSQFAFEFK